MTTPERPGQDRRPRGGPLASAIVTLSGTPDDASDIDAQLAAIAQLAVDALAPVSYASITAMRGGSHTTVAASSELAVAVDEAQYAEQGGPCLSSLADGAPVRVDDIGATIKWPGFRAAAARMGLNASLSIPLFGGSGATIAVLNLYGHDPLTMIPLSAWVWSVYQADPMAVPERDLPPLDSAGDDLIAGVTEAFEVRALIQRAIGTVMAGRGCSAEDAYRTLRVRAAGAGMSLTETARAALADVPPL